MRVFSQALRRITSAPCRGKSAYSRLCASVLPVLCACSLQAQPDTSVDAVTLKGGQVFCLRAGESAVLTNTLEMPFEVEVQTNGTFTVAKGKERTLAEGQTIRNDGWLINANGSLEPVFDHISMRAGRVTIVRDGVAMPVKETLSFPNNLRISPDASCVYPSGARTRLADGQFFRMDGSSIPGKDSVTLKNGRVVALRDGSLIPLTPVQILGMADGTRVQGDGLITKRDGSTFQLKEGETVFFEARATRQ
jgi:hypothetical protein